MAGRVLAFEAAAQRRQFRIDGSLALPRPAHDDSSAGTQRYRNFGPDQVTEFAKLAEEFAICDRWFCAFPGPTWPNRFTFLSGDLSEHQDRVEIHLHTTFDHTSIGATIVRRFCGPNVPRVSDRMAAA